MKARLTILAALAAAVTLTAVAAAGPDAAKQRVKGLLGSQDPYTKRVDTPGDEFRAADASNQRKQPRRGARWASWSSPSSCRSTA
jgi:hypothetical protein